MTRKSSTAPAPPPPIFAIKRPPPPDGLPPAPFHGLNWRLPDGCPPVVGQSDDYLPR